MPQVVTFSNGSTITYLYTADGRKLRTIHVINGTTTTTDYSGNVIYENGTQKLLLTEEGYINLSTPTTYYYYLKDHQGNNRVVVSSSGTVVETNHYYPFGGLFASSSVQPYKYNGKELDTKNGLNWYDYGARHYDATLGRWFVADPLAEKMYGWSPYGYCFNNPVKFVDEDGEMPWLVAAAVGAFVDYGFQVAQNVMKGQSMTQSLTNVDMKSIATSAAISATGIGLANVVTKGVKAVQVGTKMGKALQFASDIAVDATTSVASQVVSGEGVSAKKVMVDVTIGKGTNWVGDKLKTIKQNSETGKILHRKADRARRLASENSRASRKEQAAKATKEAENYGEYQSVVVSTGISTSLEEVRKLNQK